MSIMKQRHGKIARQFASAAWYALQTQARQHWKINALYLVCASGILASPLVTHQSPNEFLAHLSNRMHWGLTEIRTKIAIWADKPNITAVLKTLSTEPPTGVGEIKTKKHKYRGVVRSSENDGLCFEGRETRKNTYVKVCLNHPPAGIQ
jgi:hypothetical protein